MKGRKGQGLSINMIVIMALAVFVIFLVMGFMTSGWQYFTGLFGGTAKQTGGYETAKIKCESWCPAWRDEGRLNITSLSDRMYNWNMFSGDTNGNGAADDCFVCFGTGKDKTGAAVARPAACKGEALTSVMLPC